MKNLKTLSDLIAQYELSGDVMLLDSIIELQYEIELYERAEEYSDMIKEYSDGSDF